jgi:hypothetical protein
VEFFPSLRRLLLPEVRSCEWTGHPVAWFETGFEGTLWAVQEGGKTPVTLRDGDEMELHLKGKVMWSGRLQLVSSFKAKGDDYLRLYLKEHAGDRQLQFAGLWVHALPRNVDLGLWYAAFVEHPMLFKCSLKRYISASEW